ncbi:hypothetical protein NDU88_000302 [Pleurodeles waltl]|uniref:Uncharacterized protein n=1 Tax=Pleurodeles waltl TaxID=8319 RepID=A0AAV7VXZ9_PLEWA|nr:hypothetical protein NDU88_000302 [Pleurodeles waltl]
MSLGWPCPVSRHGRSHASVSRFRVLLPTASSSAGKDAYEGFPGGTKILVAAREWDISGIGPRLPEETGGEGYELLTVSRMFFMQIGSLADGTSEYTREEVWSSAAPTPSG